MRKAGVELHTELVLIDLDNTIYDFNKASEYSRKQLAEHLSRMTKAPAGLILAAYAAIAEETNQVRFSTGFQMRCCRLAALAERLGITFPIEDGARYLGEQILQSISPYPGAIQAIKLVRVHYPLMILTEGYSDIQLAAAARLGLGQYDVVATFQHGTQKRDGSAYKAIIEEKGLAASHIVMVGDSWQNDVLAPANCGIPAIWISHKKAVPSSPPKPFAGSAETLMDILPLLGLAVPGTHE